MRNEAQFFKKRAEELQRKIDSMVKKGHGEYLSYDVDGEEACNEQLVEQGDYHIDIDDWEYHAEDEAEFLLEKNKELIKHLSKYKLDFPTNIFPAEIIKHAIDAEQCLNYPLPYYLSGMLMAFSTAIGTKFRAEIMPGKEATALLMSVLVGHPAINKTSPLNAALKPLLDYENDMKKQHAKEMATYSRLSPEEKNKTTEPQPIRLITADFTMEALIQLAIRNKHGLLAYSDEFAGLLKGMNMYRKGNDEETFLQIFSDIGLRKDRMDRQEIAPNIFVNVTGTIQTEVLLNFIGGSQANNGFFDRILYVCVDDDTDMKWKNAQLNVQHKETYHQLVQSILEIPLDLDDEGEVVPRKLTFTKNGLERLIQWQHENVEFCKQINDRLLIGIAKKLEIYSGRFALILAIVDYAFKCHKLLTKKDAKIVITETHVEGAICLCRYFLNSARRLITVIPDKNNLKKTNRRFQAFYDKLPSRFDTRTAYNVAAQYNISERSVFNYLASEYFKKVSHAQYEKRYFKKV